MEDDPSIHHRRSNRLEGYDYTRVGAYFITLVTHNRKNLFGEIKEGVMEVNRFGEIVRRTWVDLPRHYPHVSLDWFVLMPNHAHAIVFLNDDTTGRDRSPVGGNARMINPTRAGVLKVSGGETRPYGTRQYDDEESHTSGSIDGISRRDPPLR